MHKQLLKTLSLIMALNFIIAYWGVEHCYAQTVSGTCTDQSGGGCFAQFTNVSVPYTTTSFQPGSCGGGLSTATLTVSGPVQISWTNNEERYPVNVSFNEVSQSNPFTISSSGTLTWGTTWCNTITFTFSPTNQENTTKKENLPPQIEQ